MSLQTRLAALITAIGADIKSLTTRVTAVEGKLVPPLVTALPGSPTNGDEVYFQTTAMATAGVPPWHLRYRTLNPDGSSNANTNKWEPVGSVVGLRAFAIAKATKVNLTVVAYGSVDANDPSLTAPVAGLYTVRNTATLDTACTVPGILSIGVKNGTTEPTRSVNAVEAYYVGASSPVTLTQEMDMVVASGTVLLQRYYQNQQTSNVDRWTASLIAIPVRVG